MLPHKMAIVLRPQIYDVISPIFTAHFFDYSCKRICCKSLPWTQSKQGGAPCFMKSLKTYVNIEDSLEMFCTLQCMMSDKSSAVADVGDRLATTGIGRKVVGLLCLFAGWGAGSPSNTMSPGPRPTSITSGILIRPTVWPRYTNVLQTVAQKLDYYAALIVWQRVQSFWYKAVIYRVVDIAVAEMNNV